MCSLNKIHKMNVHTEVNVYLTFHSCIFHFQNYLMVVRFEVFMVMKIEFTMKV